MFAFTVTALGILGRGRRSSRRGRLLDGCRFVLEFDFGESIFLRSDGRAVRLVATASANDEESDDGQHQGADNVVDVIHEAAFLRRRMRGALLHSGLGLGGRGGGPGLLGLGLIDRGEIRCAIAHVSRISILVVETGHEVVVIAGGVHVAVREVLVHVAHVIHVVHEVFRCSGILLERLLQCGDLLVLHLDHAIERIDLALQGLEFRAVDSDAVTRACTGIRSATEDATGFALAAVTGIVVDRGVRFSGDAQRRSTASSGTFLGFDPGFVLLLDFRQCRGQVTGTDVVLSRQVDDVTGLDIVDVAVDKGVGVQALDVQHRLVHGSALRPRLGGDFPEGLVAVHHVLAARHRYGGRSGIEIALGHHARREIGLSYSNGRAAGGDVNALFFCRCGNSLDFLHPLARGDHRRGVTVGEHRRIDQHSVLAQQAARWPARFDDEVQVGLQHRLFGGHDNAGPAAFDLDIKLDAGQEIGAIQPHLVKVVPGGETNFYLVAMQALGIEKIDTGLERLIEIGLEFEFPQPQSQRRFRLERPQREHHSS